MGGGGVYNLSKPVFFINGILGATQLGGPIFMGMAFLYNILYYGFIVYLNLSHASTDLMLNAPF